MIRQFLFQLHLEYRDNQPNILEIATYLTNFNYGTLYKNSSASPVIKFWMPVEPYI